MTKQTKWHVRPATTQISLGIRPVWSESSLSAWRKLGPLATHWVQAKTLIILGGSESSLGVHVILFVGFVVKRLNFILSAKLKISCWRRFQVHALRKPLCLSRWRNRLFIKVVDQNKLTFWLKTYETNSIRRNRGRKEHFSDICYELDFDLKIEIITS